MAKTFEAQVSAIMMKYKGLMEIVARESIQDLIEEMQTPKAKGGNMPVDTGFLRLSGQGSYTGMPTGPVRGREDAGKDEYKYDPGPVIALLSGMKMGLTFFWGWTAVYARKQNVYNGFRDLPLQNWQKIVNAVVQRVSKRI